MNSNTNNNYNLYIIYNNNASYVGITNNLKKRLRQHNNEIKGGAKYTTSKGNGWKYACHISGFKSKNDVLKIEWAIKHEKPKYKFGIENRILKMISVLKKNKWTKKSPSSFNYNLTLNWHELLLIPDEIETLPNYINNDIDDSVIN